MALKTQTGIPLQTKLGPSRCSLMAHVEIVGYEGREQVRYVMSYLFNLSSFPQLSTPSACLAAIVFTSEYETTSSIFMTIKQEPHQLWMASNNYVFGDGLLYVLNVYICIHNTLPWLRQ